jgi:hypothetical protein
VQTPERLPRARIDRHGAADVVLADLDDADADAMRQRVRTLVA